MILLNAQAIKNHINDNQLNSIINFHILESIDSTNTFLKNLKNKHYLDICCAEQQTAGRGRLGKSWHSPFGENIYLSLSYIFKTSAIILAPLSLTIGISIIQVLNALGITENLKIKWPNDIYWHAQKLAGILIEISNCNQRDTNLIIGVGINVNSDFQDLKTYPWASLFNITQKKYDRNTIIAHLISKIHENLYILLNKSFSDFLHVWQQHDYLYGKSITVKHMNTLIQGICSGIDTSGELRLTCENGKIITLNSSTQIINF